MGTKMEDPVQKAVDAYRIVRMRRNLAYALGLHKTGLPSMNFYVLDMEDNVTICWCHDTGEVMTIVRVWSACDSHT